jgi:hypothetical protein
VSGPIVPRIASVTPAADRSSRVSRYSPQCHCWSHTFVLLFPSSSSTDRTDIFHSEGSFRRAPKGEVVTPNDRSACHPESPEPRLLAAQDDEGPPAVHEERAVGRESFDRPRPKRRGCRWAQRLEGWEEWVVPSFVLSSPRSGYATRDRDRPSGYTPFTARCITAAA